MMPLEIPELWDSFRSTSLAIDASERDVEAAWSPFHGGIFALARRLACEFELYKLLGVPAALVAKGPADHKAVTAMFQRVDRLRRRPEGFTKTRAPMFYGKLRGDPRVKLQGISGGLIFGFVHVRTDANVIGSLLCRSARLERSTSRGCL